MNVLSSRNIKTIHHYTPLHYLPFIARSGFVLSKPILRASGFSQKHFRSMSNRQDVERGFAGYVHLFIGPYPRILEAKLQRGFPHVGIAVPAAAIEAVPFSLCRFNVAMTRRLRRNGKPGFPESPTNGRYYDRHEIPIARIEADKAAMLDKHLQSNIPIEVLIHERLLLPEATEVVCFSDDDLTLAKKVLEELCSPWAARLARPPTSYLRDAKHVRSVEAFLDRALSDPGWRGNGLEFDRL